MKASHVFTALTLLAGAPSETATAVEGGIPRESGSLSFRNEIQLAIDKGLAWLKAHQNADGSWSLVEHPALTALPIIAFQRDPSGIHLKTRPAFLEKGYAFLRSHAKPDGGIYGKGLSNYNTSLSLVALLNSGNPADEPLLAKAREFIVAQQAGGMANPALDGGIGYGPTGVSPKRAHPDLDNTVVALEALRAFKAERPTVETDGSKQLNWKAAEEFLTRCQNLPAHNREPWASGDPDNRGGFVYYPGFSNAGEQKLPTGKTALRSYGSMTYGGLLSFIYADLRRSDPRVTAALDWLKKHYTVDENPGLDRQGLYYYYHLMAKALASAGIDELETPAGQKIDWRRELGHKLINLQNADGSWANDTARWMEKDPVLVTSYCLLALEIIHQRL